MQQQPQPGYMVEGPQYMMQQQDMQQHMFVSGAGNTVQYNNNNNMRGNNNRHHIAGMPTQQNGAMYYHPQQGVNGVLDNTQQGGNATNQTAYSSIPQQQMGVGPGGLYMPVDGSATMMSLGAGQQHLGMGNMVAVPLQQGGGYYIPQQQLAQGALYLDPTQQQQGYYRVGGLPIYGQQPMAQPMDEMSTTPSMMMYQDQNGNFVDSNGISYIIPYATPNGATGNYWGNQMLQAQTGTNGLMMGGVQNGNNRRNVYPPQQMNGVAIMQPGNQQAAGTYIMAANGAPNAQGTILMQGQAAGQVSQAGMVGIMSNQQQFNANNGAMTTSATSNTAASNAQNNSTRSATPGSPQKASRGGMNASATAFTGATNTTANNTNIIQPTGGYHNIVAAPQLGYAAAVVGGGMLAVDGTTGGQILMQVDAATGVAMPVSAMVLPQLNRDSSNPAGNGGRGRGDRNNNRGNSNGSSAHNNSNQSSNAGSNNNNANAAAATGGSAVRDSVVEDFRNTYGKTRQWDIRDLIGHVVAFCQDQHGSRFIQQRLEVALDDEKQLVFEEVLVSAHSLMTDVFGNYVIQKLFEYGTPAQCETLAVLLMGQAVPLALQMYGCRVIQKALEYVNTDRLVAIIQEFETQPVRDVLRCVHDQNGNHVIQKCIEVISRLAKDANTETADYLSSRIQFIINAFQGRVRELSMHPYGCRVVQRILEHCTNNQKSSILDELRQCCNELIQDQYGNYVIQHVMQHGWEPDRAKLVKEVQSRLLEYSQHKFASNVVEKCLQYADMKDRDEMIWTIINVTFDLNNPVDAKTGQCVLESMVRDPYANYVVQKVIDVSHERQRGAIIRYVRENIVQLRRYTYGKHIIVRLEKVSGEKF
jgi:pumilio RNA-binding family